MTLWSAHPLTGALNYMFMSSYWTGLPMNGTRWHITCPITQISCRKIISSNSFWGKWYFVFGQKNVQWQEKCFFLCLEKNLSEWCETVKWYGNMNCLFHAWLDTLPVLPSNVSLNLIQNLDFMFIYSQVLYQSMLLLYTIPSPTPFSCTSRPWRWDNTQPEQAGRQCWVGIILVSCPSSRWSLFLAPQVL